VGLAALAMAATACGDSTSAERSTATSSTAGTTSTSTPASTSTTPASTTAASTTAPSGGPTTAPPATAPTTSVLGPEWRQQDGRVLIEAVASGDPQQLLADLVALGLTDGVLFGRLVDGWLPIERFDDAQRLDSVQFLQPTPADTGAGAGG
jgi:hypothetical protein